MASAKPDDLLTAKQISTLTGIPPMIVPVCRNNGSLIGVLGEDGEYRYPRWQIDKDHGTVLKGVKAIMDLCEGDASVAAKHLTQELPDGEGRKLYEHLRDGNPDAVLERLREVLAGQPI